MRLGCSQWSAGGLAGTGGVWSGIIAWSALSDRSPLPPPLGWAGLDTQLEQKYQNQIGKLKTTSLSQLLGNISYELVMVVWSNHRNYRSLIDCRRISLKNCNSRVDQINEALLSTGAIRTKLRPGWRGVKLVVKVNRQLGQKLERNEKFMGLNGLNWVIDYKPCVLKLLLPENEGIPCEILFWTKRINKSWNLV